MTEQQPGFLHVSAIKHRLTQGDYRKNSRIYKIRQFFQQLSRLCSWSVYLGPAG